MKRPHRILYVRTDRIGDVLMNLPALRVLRRAYPKAWITLWAPRPVADLLRGHPDLDETMPLDTAGLRRSWIARWKGVRTLRKARFDMAIAADPDKWIHALLWASGIPLRYGYARKWGGLLNRKAGRAVEPSAHEIERNLGLVSLAAPGEWDGRIELPSDEYARDAIVRRLDAEGPGAAWAVLHTGTSDPRKRWPAERWAELSEHLRRQRGLRTLLIGDAAERNAAEIVTHRTPDAVDWTGRTSLRELTELLRLPRVAAMVSSDSGPAHLAWIVGTPLVALYPTDYSGSDPVRWGPRGQGPSRIVRRALADIDPESVSLEVLAVERSRLSR